MTEIVNFLNENCNNNHPLICKWLTSYIHSSYRYAKRNSDGSWEHSQPAFPDRIVISYQYYSDKSKSFAHHTNRLMLVFDDTTNHDISIYKFKQFLRKHSLWIK